MKTLKFVPKLVPLVKSGEKTCTWRLFDDKDLSVADELLFMEHGSNQEFATARIISVREKSLADIGPEDFDGHEKFSGTEEMFKTYQSYYGDSVSFEILVKIIAFEIINIL